MGQAKRRRGASRKRLTVAVCVPTIPGREDQLDRALWSAKLQDRKPDQILVERDSLRTGAAQARNRLLDRVDTDVIAWLDDDDQLLPTHLGYCMRVLERSLGSLESPAGLVYPIPRMIGRDPTATTYQGHLVGPWKVRFGAEQEAHLRRRGSFIPMTHLVRTDHVRAIEGFRDGYRVDEKGQPDANGIRYRGEDEDYLIRLLDHGVVFEHLPKTTWVWNAHPETSTAGLGGGHGR